MRLQVPMPPRRAAVVLLGLSVVALHLTLLAAAWRGGVRGPATGAERSPAWRLVAARTVTPPDRPAAPAAAAARPEALAGPPADTGQAPRRQATAPAQAAAAADSGPDNAPAALADPAADGNADATAEWTLPRYATRPPDPTSLLFELRRAPRRDGREPPPRRLRLDWVHDGERYALTITPLPPDRPAPDREPVARRAAPDEPPGATSRGRLDERGLAPERFVERERGRDRRAASFEREGPAPPRTRFSGGAPDAPLPEAGQDRLSWLLQLAAVLEAEPALRDPGQEVALWVAGPRGGAAWRFEVLGAAVLETPEGRRPALQLRRRAPAPYTLQVEVWLDPERQHLPLRVEQSAPPGPWATTWQRLPPERGP